MATLGDAALRPFQSMAEQNPVANNRIAQGQQAARTASLQQTVAAAPPTVNTAQAAQQLGAQQAQKAGEIKVNAAKATVEGQQQIGQAAIAAEQATGANAIGKKQLATKQRAYELAGKLQQIDKNLKNKLLDETVSFEKDDMTRTLFNERQLMDYKMQSLQNDVQLQKYEQDLQQLTDKRLQMLKVAYSKVEQELTQVQQRGQQTASQVQLKSLEEAKIALEQKIARETARRKNRAAMFTAAGTIVGAVAGAYMGNPMAGAAIGGGIGTAAASATE